MAAKCLYELRACRSEAASRSQTTNRISEKIMSMHHSLAAALWLLAAFGAYILAASWANDVQSGKLQPWVLLMVFWGAALASVAIHHLSLYLSKCLAQGSDALKTYQAHYRRAVRAIRYPSGMAAAASAAVQDLRRHVVRAVAQLKRHWPEHTSADGPARSLPAVGGHSVTLAAKLGALIGVR
jgi:hypothetical protein